MTSIGTPNNIDVLLHCHTTSYRHERYDAGAVQEALALLFRMGAIKTVPDGDSGIYTTTALGKAWVQALCNVPPPKSVFVDEQGRVLG